MFLLFQNCNVHLHTEVELLKKALSDKQIELSAMRSACYQESERQGELEDVVLAWQDKFERLYESHKKVQKINQSLEDKLLKLVDRNSGERAQLASDCATLNIRLTQANYNISSLQREIVSVTAICGWGCCDVISHKGQNYHRMGATKSSVIALNPCVFGFIAKLDNFMKRRQVCML